jgi:diguanylate cyclase (GGDEF)-like protein
MLLFFDVDYFKQVNDRFGHEAGDRILVSFTALLKKHFGELGFVSRYGGDEFVVLLDSNSKEDVTILLENLKQDVYQVKPTDNPVKNDGFRLSFSAGAACYPEDAETLGDLKHCADLALYDVKERGRNGYLWYRPELEKLDVNKKS